ncbi:MAG: NTPase [Candidatus Bathyarchaeota archaeon]|nr:NTPase [Candidatus Bathyarchaeota archaeon]
MLKKRVLLITGSPGTGKTSVLLKTIDALKARGYSVGGVISREARAGWTRVGFEILDLGSGRRGWLAHVNRKVGPRVGKYGVNLEDLEDIGANAIVNAAENFDVVAIDEIGPMELFSEKFKEAVKKAVECGKVVVGVVHWKARDRLIEEVKNREDTEILEVTSENRNKLHETIVEKAVEFLKTKERQQYS